MYRMSKPKFIKEIENFEGKRRAKCGRWYIRVYGELDNKPMVELESLETVVRELHKLEEENKKLKSDLSLVIKERDDNMGECKKLEEENRKLKLHIEAKDKAYIALLKDYEELKEDNKRLRAEIEEWLNSIRQKI